MQLQRDLPLFKRAGLGLAAVSYDSPACLQDFAARRGISFPLLSDHDSKLVRAFGVADRKYHKGSEITLNSTEYVPVEGLSYPAVFVIGTDRKVRWRFVSEHEDLRLTGGTILHRTVGLVATRSRVPVQGKRVEVEATASDSSAGLGSRLFLGVELQIAPGLHAYAPAVTGEYRGIAWNMNGSDCFINTEAEYPAPVWRQMAFTHEELPVFEGKITITREVIVRSAVSSNPAALQLFRERCVDPQSRLRITGALQFQVCDETQCFPPQTVPLQWNVRFLSPDLTRAPMEHWRAFEP